MANTIQCPKCYHEMDVDTILYNQIQQEANQNYQLKVKEISEQYNQKLEGLEQDKLKLNTEKDNFEKIIAEKLKEEVTKEKTKLEKDNIELRKKIKEEVKNKTSAQIDEYEKQLKDKSEEIRDLLKAKADVARLKLEKDELQDKIAAEYQEKLNQTLKDKTLQIQTSEREKNELKIAEREKIIGDLNQKLTEAQLKIEQGSIQLQGEVQELAIESWLKNNFPFDNIKEVAKGARGADCIQTVNTREMLNCGTIYYESKRTKEFGNKWIEKFKEDMRLQGAYLGVIVTQVMPVDMERMGIKDDIWICSFEEFKNLSYVLREYLIKINSMMIAQDNKESKMEQLYGYLTSNSFKLQIDSIISSFEDMQNDLIKERKYLEGIWKKREKQIDKVLKSSVDMYTSVKSIAGSVIQDLQPLELPMDEDIDI
jgi:hypothetical protein